MLKPIYVSLALAALTLIVYFQIHDFEFVNFDDRESHRRQYSYSKRLDVGRIGCRHYTAAPLTGFLSRGYRT